MANKEKKGLNTGVYAVVTSIILAVVLVILSIFTVATKYTAFSPEKIAQSFVDTVVQTGDGYNAYKITLVSKNQKYGEFIKAAYMRPYVNDGDDVKQADFVGTGSTKEQEAIDSVYNTMYEYYVELIKTYGYDDYDAIFDNYFKKLVEVRHNVYGDDYMNMDYMFGAFEANVQTYANSLTGTRRVFAQDDKTILTEESIGSYQIMFGEMQDVEVDALVNGKKQTVTEKQPVYKLTAEVKECKELSADETKAYVDEYAARIKPVAESGAAKADSFGITDIDKKKTYKSDMVDAFARLDCSKDIDSVAKATVEVKIQTGETVATQELYVVKIGKSWYVDNTNINTSGLYLSQGDE